MPERESWKRERSNSSDIREPQLRRIADFSTGNVKPEGSGLIYSMCWKKKDWQQGIQYPSKLSFRIEGEIMTF